MDVRRPRSDESLQINQYDTNKALVKLQRLLPDADLRHLEQQTDSVAKRLETPLGNFAYGLVFTLQKGTVEVLMQDLEKLIPGLLEQLPPIRTAVILDVSPLSARERDTIEHYLTVISPYEAISRDDRHDVIWRGHTDESPDDIARWFVEFAGSYFNIEHQSSPHDEGPDTLKFSPKS